MASFGRRAHRVVRPVPNQGRWMDRDRTPRGERWYRIPVASDCTQKYKYAMNVLSGKRGLRGFARGMRPDDANAKSSTRGDAGVATTTLHII